MSFSIAMLSVHTSPLDRPGQTKDAGGMNVYIRELATQLGQRGLSIDIFTRWTNEQTPQIVQLAPYVRVIHIAAGPLAPVHKNELCAYLPAFVHQVAEFRRRASLRYDAIHSHYWLSASAAMQLSWRWDIPHVTMFHTLARLKQLANPNEPEPQQRLETEQRLIQQADCIIAATQEERTQIIRSCGATANQVRVIPCGVDLKLFVSHNRQQMRKKLGLEPQRPVLLFAGRLDPFKGPDLLLRAAALMEEDAQIVLVGGKKDDAEVQRLQELARELKLRERVRFLEARPQQELPALYSAADVTVVPSYHESFGLVAVESLACGTPVVATRAGGLTTIVRHGETGYLVPRGPGFFAQHLDMLLGDRALLERMRTAARPSVLQFSWQNVARQVEDVYEALISAASCLEAL